MTERDDSLLIDARKAIVTWGGTLIRSYRDSEGEYAIRFRLRNEHYLGVCKQYPDDNRASFMQTDSLGRPVVERARDNDLLIVEFFGEQPTLADAYVFHPQTILDEANPSWGRSKQNVDTEWYELSLKHGALLGDYLAGRDTPPDPPSSGPTPKSLLDYA